jgi:galactokinase
VYTDVEHSLVDSEYNTRRKECETSVALISEQYKAIEHLSQLIPSDLSKIKLDEPLYRRAKFVVEENQRVREVVELLSNGNIEAIGTILNASHLGLSTEYEVSTPEVDWLVSRLQQSEKVAGSRMIGGGFGGSILVLLKSTIDDPIQRIVDEYNAEYEKKAFAFNAHSGYALRKV